MWSNLILLHFDQIDSSKEELTNFVSWHTCMRSVYLSDDRLLPENFALNTPANCKLYQGFAAYSFLLEIVCGLHSKLYGESEIQAQFRDRFSDLNLGHASLNLYFKKLRNQLLEHTKLIRTEFLAGLGRQTYGSLTERHLGNEKELHLFGTGKLAEALLPYLSDKGRKVKIYGRDASRLAELRLKFPIESYFWEDFQPNNKPVIIASSFFPDHWMEKVLTSSLILDFREGVESELGKTKAAYVPFSTFLNSITKTENHIISLKPKINNRITSLTFDREYEQLQFVNGWEDLSSLCY